MHVVAINQRPSFAELFDHHPGQSARALADKALRQARELMGADAGALFLVRRDAAATRYLELAAAQPHAPDGVPAVPIEHGSVVAHVARTGETAKFADVHTGTFPMSFHPAIDACHGVAPQCAGRLRAARP